MVGTAGEKEQVPALFGCNVFSEDVMAQYVPRDAMEAWRYCLRSGTHLKLSVANDIAEGMKNWALERGATHYTHWFQPMTGFTAEKHDSFISPSTPGKILMEFSGKELVRGEPDASSFPSGGLRATFEARGYTAWDPTSHAFLKDDTLCIPTVFCSYSGEALDKKTPLLRSVEEVNKQALRVLRLFGDEETKKVTPQVGAEQEYFLVDRERFEQREDLKLCGRTLFGSNPPKGQELDDHYFGVIKPRIAAYMRELDEELWRMGILSKTRHNEVAPAQHEMAPIYCDVNTASDHNQLTMEIMKKVALRHGLVCLLHEKPFAGVNGSGKHNNWSLSTDTGRNLFAPGKTPSQNAQFLLFLAAFIQGVDDYQELFRCAVASPGNDHRLGAQEAPPAIVSIFLGNELSGIIDSIIGGTDYVDQGKRSLRIGVDVLPHIPQDTTDRNRTSPLAFTGNKFELRMLGSSQSISGPNVVLNTIMAESLGKFADQLEQAADFGTALHDIIRDALQAHRRIIFDGNGYDDTWVTEAQRRGLANLPSTADALPLYVMPKNVDLFTRHGIFTQDELVARQEIHMENYCKVLHIEAMTMLDMVQRNIIGAVSAYSSDLCQSILRKQQALPGVSCQLEQALAASITELEEQLLAAADALKDAVEHAPVQINAAQGMQYYHDQVLPRMDAVRSIVDQLESKTAREYWPYPTYYDLLFCV